MAFIKVDNLHVSYPLILEGQSIRQLAGDFLMGIFVKNKGNP